MCPLRCSVCQHRSPHPSTRTAKPASWLVATVTLGVAPLSHAVRYQAEDGTLLGNTFVTSDGAGYDGTGFVRGFTNDWADRLRIDTVDVSPGLYELTVGYSSPYGDKGYNVVVGGESGGGFFQQTATNTFTENVAGLFDLTTGQETIEIGGNWGYYLVDYLELEPYVPTPTAPVLPRLSNPGATPAAWELMNYLTSEYGNRTLAGQQVHQRSGYIDSAYLQRSGGLAPAVYASDFIDYSPTRSQYETPSPESERAVQWAQDTGGVVSMMWHWNAPSGLGLNGEPWWRGFYSDATSFNLTSALNNPGSDDHNLLLRDIHAIGDELQKFDDAGVPVLWRPLHEAQGGWFWWGEEGAEPFRDLWNLMYDELTHVRGLDNLIWVYTFTGDIEGSDQWFPVGDGGEDVVDIVGIDLYNGSRDDAGEWLELIERFDGDYLLALTETGDAIDAQAVEGRGVDWSWFTPWSFEDVMVDLTEQELRDLLGHEKIITLDELPLFSWSMALAGDYNGNGQVEQGDLDLVLANWGGLGSGGTPAGWVNDLPDGLIDQAELDAVLANWGSTSAPDLRGIGGATVPEPTAATVLAVLLTGRARRGVYAD